MPSPSRSASKTRKQPPTPPREKGLRPAYNLEAGLSAAARNIGHYWGVTTGEKLTHAQKLKRALNKAAAESKPKGGGGSLKGLTRRMKRLPRNIQFLGMVTKRQAMKMLGTRRARRGRAGTRRRRAH